MNFELLNTEDLTLRKLTPEVYTFVHTHYDDKKLAEFFGFSSREEIIKSRAKHSMGMSTFNRSFVNFQLMDKSSGEIIGGCGFHTWYFEHQRAEIGYDLKFDSYKRKGLMTQALKLVLDYGFTSMDLNRVEACIGPKNDASIALVKKFGFVQEGLMRQHYKKDTGIEDSIMFSLLRSEYPL
jgi:ribosomal-protein-alanine N-acetyltransferase